MKRKDFFKKLGIGLVTVVAAPKVLEAMPPVTEEEESFCISDIVDELNRTGQIYTHDWHANMNTELMYNNGWHVPCDEDREIFNNQFIWNVKYFNEIEWVINDIVNIGGMDYICQTKEEDRSHMTYTFIPLGRKDGSDPIIKMHYLKIEVCYD